ncbi:MAG TPA: dihydrodipicolinate synthase family protein [Bryobacteraceae bacterium]|nr:dihydrodipicolinate synthase family protein [Bryobacteraceae bacterium]
MKLQGIFAEITTPFDHKGDIYKAKVQHNVEKWNRTTLAGYVVCGSAGEGGMLSSEEKIAVWQMAASFAANEKLLIAAAGMPGVRETVALANRAAELGYKAALVHSRHPHPEVQLLYFRAVADQSRIPVIAAGAVPDIARPAAGHPNIIAVCDRTCSKVLPDIQMLVGSAAHLWPALEAGASGAILDFAAAAPYAAIAIWEAHRTREHEAGVDWQNRIARAAELVNECHHGVPSLKHAMDLTGYYGGPPRLPLAVPRPEVKREIEDAFRDLPADR